MYKFQDEHEYCATPETIESPRLMEALPCPENCSLQSFRNISEIEFDTNLIKLKRHQVEKNECGKYFFLKFSINIKTHSNMIVFVLQNIEVKDYCAIYDCIEKKEDYNSKYEWQPIIKTCLCFKNYEEEVENLFSNPEYPKIDQANRDCSLLEEKKKAKKCETKQGPTLRYQLKNLTYDDENDKLSK